MWQRPEQININTPFFRKFKTHAHFHNTQNGLINESRRKKNYPFLLLPEKIAQYLMDRL